MILAYGYLILAIVTEVLATSALKASEEFTKLWPSTIVVLGYVASFYFMMLALRTLPIGITYAIWSGIGIAAITIIGKVYYQQTPDLAAIIGIIFITLGVIIISVFSNAGGH